MIEGLALGVKGLTGPEIVERLSVRRPAGKAHVSNIQVKPGAFTRMEAIPLARSHSLVT